jgi:hypothetical protein
MGKVHVEMNWEPVYIRPGSNVDVRIRTESRDILDINENDVQKRPWCAFRTHQYEFIFLAGDSNDGRDEDNVLVTNNNRINRPDLSFRHVEVRLYGANSDYDAKVKAAAGRENVDVTWTEKLTETNGVKHSVIRTNLFKDPITTNAPMKATVEWIDPKEFVNKPSFNTWYHFKLEFYDYIADSDGEQILTNTFTLASNAFRIVSKPSVWLANSNKLYPGVDYQIPSVPMENRQSSGRRGNVRPTVNAVSDGPITRRDLDGIVQRIQAIENNRSRNTQLSPPNANLVDIDYLSSLSPFSPLDSLNSNATSSKKKSNKHKSSSKDSKKSKRK